MINSPYFKNRAIYDQGLEASMFAGMVSLTPLFSEAFQVKGGNSLMVEKLFSYSRANVLLDHQVLSVIPFNSTLTLTARNSSTSLSKASKVPLFFFLVF